MWAHRLWKCCECFGLESHISTQVDGGIAMTMPPGDECPLVDAGSGRRTAGSYGIRGQCTTFPVADFSTKECCSPIVCFSLIILTKFGGHKAGPLPPSLFVGYINIVRRLQRLLLSLSRVDLRWKWRNLIVLCERKSSSLIGYWQRSKTAAGITPCPLNSSHEKRSVSPETGF